MSPVQKKNLIPNELQLSELVQGYWRMSDWGKSIAEHEEFLNKHVELGVTTVDHAHVYGNPSCEEVFGKVLEQTPSMRERLQIITKCGIQVAGENEVATPHYCSTEKSILEQVEQSLRRLKIESIDLLLLHRPDYLMNGDEVAEVFERLRQTGKVRCFGVSNFTVPQFSLLQSRLDFPLATNQIEINPVHLNSIKSGILEYCQEKKVMPMAWSCLAGGALFQDENAKLAGLKKELASIQMEVGASSLEEVVYAWVLKLPSNPIPILGSGRYERIQAACNALHIKLSHEQWYRILVASQGHDVE